MLNLVVYTLSKFAYFANIVFQMSLKLIVLFGAMYLIGIIEPSSNESILNNFSFNEIFLITGVSFMILLFLYEER